MMNHDSPLNSDNPFDLTKASDFSDKQILNYWVDVVEEHGGLSRVLSLTSVMPMLLLGGKGSGKTHLMRYCSAPVQAMRYENCLNIAIKQEGYVGIYVSADGLNVGRFAGKGQSSETWSAIFGFYFELWLVLNLVSVLRLKTQWNENGFDENAFVKEVAALFDIPPPELEGIEGLYTFLESKLRGVDAIVNNSAVTRSLDGIEVTFSPGKLCFGVPPLIEKFDRDFSEVIFVYLIDEIENLTLDQQRFINSLIRYRKGNSTIRVGARLYGIKTYETIGSGEPIKVTAEYDRVELDGFLRGNEKEYSRLAAELVAKRLNLSAPNAPEMKDVSCFFESIDAGNYYQKLTMELVGSRKNDAKYRPYFDRLKGHLTEVFGRDSDAKVSQIIERLRVEDYPLIEKLNILQLYKGWGGPKQIADRASMVQEDAKHAISGMEVSKEYAQTYEHFDSDLLAQLFRDYSRKIPYAGLDTLIHMSQGVPRNLLGVLKQIYRRALFAGEKPFIGGVISHQSQTEGVMDSAAWFWDDAQPDSYGAEVRDAVERLAVLFRTIRYSDKPSECDLCTFSIDESKISGQAKLTLERAQN